MLRQKSFGISVGIFLGLFYFYLFIFSLASHHPEIAQVLSLFYFHLLPISYFGAFLALIFGLIDGFILGWLFALLYNFLSFREWIEKKDSKPAEL